MVIKLLKIAQRQSGTASKHRDGQTEGQMEGQMHMDRQTDKQTVITQKTFTIMMKLICDYDNDFNVQYWFALN